MTTRAQQIDFYPRETKTIVIKLVADGASYPTANPDVQFIWTLAKTADAAESEVLLRKSLGDGITVSESEPGVIEIALSSADTAMEPTWYFHQLTIIDGDDRSVALVGAVQVRRVMAIGELRRPTTLEASIDSTVPLVGIA
jgi:hypothetical protein